MRIAVFSHYFLPEIGAPSARLGDFSTQWIGAGNEVHVITCFPNHPTGVVYPGFVRKRYEEQLLNGVHVHRNGTYLAANKGVISRTVGHLSFWLSARMNTVPRLSNMTCTIGSSPTLFAALAARGCAKRLNIPFIMEVRDLWPAIFRDLGVIRNPTLLRCLERLELNLYHSAARIVTVTDSFREDIVARGIPASKVVTITNGAETEFWKQEFARPQPLREALGLKGKFVVLYIGAHGISQGLRSQLRAAFELRTNSNIQFLFVGDGSDKRRLMDEARRLGLTNVSFHDPVGRDEARDFYGLADVCLVPLRDIKLFHTFIPSKIFEIMAMSRSMVASVAGEAAEILRSSGSAHVVPPEDHRAVAEAVLNLSQDSSRSQRMGEMGRTFVVRNYTRERLAKRYLDVISEVQVEFNGKSGTRASEDMEYNKK